MAVPAPRVLIAGAGDLGGRIAARLSEHGCDVWSIARRARPAEPNLLSLDLSQPITCALPEVDWLVHCLSPAARDEAAYRATYVDSLHHLLDALPHTLRVAFVSSTAVYGDHGGAVIDESASCTPGAFNGQVLLEAERLAAASAREALILRLGGLYGPGREALLRRVRSGEPIAIGPPPLYTNRIEIDDAAAAIAHLVGSDARGVFNIVDDAPAAQGDVLDWIADALSLPRLPRLQQPVAGDNRRVSNARLRGGGVRLRYPDFRDGYRHVIEAALERGAE